MTDAFRIFRPWFYAAAIYNAVWGIAVVVFPGTLLQVAGLRGSGASPLVQVVGMMVGVYAYGYYLLARDPKRDRPCLSGRAEEPRAQVSARAGIGPDAHHARNIARGERSRGMIDAHGDRD